MRVLFVEDSESLRRSVRRALRHAFSNISPADVARRFRGCEVGTIMKINIFTKEMPACILAAMLGLTMPIHLSRAVVPIGPPTFTNPLNITNVFFPFVPGATKVYTGVDEGKRATGVDVYGDETRIFNLNGQNVTCRVLREYSFVRGKLVEISKNYFAQADDGSVYYFGEVVDIYEDGVVVSHEGSWLVGGPQLDDPPEVATDTEPTVFMPANPELGDIYKPEDLSGIVDESDEIIAIDKDERVPAGRYHGVMIVRESSQLDAAIERKWYAPGVGVLKARTKGELLVLSASTLIQP
jgi:hypothetical protein